MSLRACSRQSELRQAIEGGFWPHAAPADLRAHVDRCGECRSLVGILLAFRSARDTTVAAARLETPGALWWRAQLRRRNADLQRLKLPLLLANGFAVLVCLVGAALFLAPSAGAGWNWLQATGEWPAALRLDLLLPAGMQSPFALGVSIAMALLLAAAVLAGIWHAANPRSRRIHNG